MEQFFGILQRGLGQLDATGEYEEGTLRELKESYQKFDAAMQQNMLRVIEQSLAKFPITLQIYIWSPCWRFFGMKKSFLIWEN